MYKNKKERKKNNSYLIFLVSLLLSSFAVYTANKAYNKSKISESTAVISKSTADSAQSTANSAQSTANSAQSNLDLKLTDNNIVPDNSSNSFTVFPSTYNSGSINLKLNGTTEDRIVLKNKQGAATDSVNLKCINGGITLRSSLGIIKQCTPTYIPRLLEPNIEGQTYFSTDILGGCIFRDTGEDSPDTRIDELPAANALLENINSPTVGTYFDFFIMNTGNRALQIKPGNGNEINGRSGDALVSIPSGKTIKLTAMVINIQNPEVSYFHQVFI